MSKIKFVALVLALAISTSFLRCEQNEKPYLILVSLDGFRWDFAARNYTPNLDKLAARGVKAASLRPVYPSMTFPNHISIITGMHPENHGIISNHFYNPHSGEEYSLFDSSSVVDPKWYLGEAFWETARRNGIITASYFWPGSELSAEYRRPNYFEPYEHKRDYGERIKGVMRWLRLPEAERPRFVTLYFHETDSKGHKFGPDSPETDAAVVLLDSIVGVLVDSLARLPFADKINVITLSDHGMTAVSRRRTVNLDSILRGEDCVIQNYGAYSMIQPKGKTKKIYGKLKESENHFKTYLKEDIPEHYHFSNHPYISDIFLEAEPGWLLIDGSSTYALNMRGAHGFDNNALDMHGIFYAAGPAFKSGYSTGTLWNIDVYPLLCEIFGIKPRSFVDGKPERINFILKRK